MLKELLRVRPAQTELPSFLAPAPETKPNIPSAPLQLAEPAEDKHRAVMDEYARIAKSIGFNHPHINSDLAIENFKAFLRRKDWPIFALPTVISYMDKKAEAESAEKSGWLWRPLREKDHIKGAKFGREGRHLRTMHIGAQIQIASDYYQGAGNRYDPNNEMHREMEASAPFYDKLVPLHALRKVAQIEAEYKGEIKFFVCDYAPAPHIFYADPFLMAVVNNARLDKGYGRFVIDFWDEPGFGLEQQLGITPDE